jgi:hypothetical protein
MTAENAVSPSRFETAKLVYTVLERLASIHSCQVVSAVCIPLPCTSTIAAAKMRACENITALFAVNIVSPINSIICPMSCIPDNEDDQRSAVFRWNSGTYKLMLPVWVGALQCLHASPPSKNHWKNLHMAAINGPLYFTRHVSAEPTTLARSCRLPKPSIFPVERLCAPQAIPGCVLSRAISVSGCVLSQAIFVLGCVLSQAIFVPGCVLPQAILIPGCVLSRETSSTQYVCSFAHTSGCTHIAVTEHSITRDHTRESATLYLSATQPCARDMIVPKCNLSPTKKKKTRAPATRNYACVRRPRKLLKNPAPVMRQCCIRVSGLYSSHSVRVPSSNQTKTDPEKTTSLSPFPNPCPNHKHFNVFVIHLTPALLASAARRAYRGSKPI